MSVLSSVPVPVPETVSVSVAAGSGGAFLESTPMVVELLKNVLRGRGMHQDR